MTTWTKDDRLAIWMKPSHWQYRKCQKANHRFTSLMASSEIGPINNL